MTSAESALPIDPIRVVIIDDHEVVALGLRALLDDEFDIEVAAYATTLESGAATIAAEQPDVVLIDYRLPDGNGVDFIRSLREAENCPGIVMLTAHADRRVLSQALDAGCNGFLSKNADRSDLATAVRSAKNHEGHFSPDVVRHLSHMKRFDVFDIDALSTRECEVLQLCAEGMSPETIAGELYLSAHTVRNHIRNSMTKLGAHSKLEAVVKAARLRLISIDD